MSIFRRRRTREEIERVFSEMRDRFIEGFESGSCRDMTEAEFIETNERYRQAAEQALIREQIK
jgi:hypothetical protein